MTLKAIAINKLLPSDKNVRKTKAHASADAELKASIKSHGLLQNLVVEPSAKKKGFFEVLAGERRRVALVALAKEGHLKDTTTVECHVTDESQAEISLAENALRQNMHPADEFEAFSRLINIEKLSTEDVANRFGTTVRHVEQRMALAQVHPEILKGYREGKTTLDVVKAFTIEPDQKKQLKVWKEVKNHEPEADEIRQELQEARIDSDHGIVKFVTLKAYKAAGGTTQDDLFGDECYINDQDLLMRLANEKLQKHAEKIKAEGWSWVDTRISINYNEIRSMFSIEGKADKELQKQYDRLEKEYQDLDAKEDDSNADKLEKLADEMQEIENKINSSLIYNPAEMKLAGCILAADRRGKLECRKGLVKQEDKKALDELRGDKPKRAKKTAAEEEKDDRLPMDDDNEIDGDQPESPELSQSLLADLTDDRMLIAQAHLAANAEIARDLLYFSLCQEVLLLNEGCFYDELALRLNANTTTHLHELDEDNRKAAQELKGMRDALVMSWKDEDLGKAFLQFHKLESARKQQLMAFCVGVIMRGQLANLDEDAINPVLEAAIQLLGIKWHHYWRPTADNFLGRLTRDQLNSIGEPLHGGTTDEWKAVTSKENKAQLVDRVERLIKEKAPNWMPDGFETR